MNKVIIQIIPEIIQWGRTVEKQIIQTGVPLTEERMKDAMELGILRPELIRVLSKDKIDIPPFPFIGFMAKKMGLSLDDVAGITFGYGIEVITLRANDRKLLVHEMVHVRQYEKLGFGNFLTKYILGCVELGYENSPMEREADELTEKLCNGK